jgi:hypothetical protein
MNAYYTSQLVRDEPMTIHPSRMTISCTLEFRPVLAGTVVAEIRKGDGSLILRIPFDENGKPFNCVGTEECLQGMGSWGTICDSNARTVQIILTKSLPDDAVAKVNYEYTMDEPADGPA